MVAAMKQSDLERAARKRLGANIKLLREQRGWDVPALAEQLAVTDDALRKYERGDRQPSLLQIIYLADVFGVSLDLLLIGDAKTRKPPRIVEWAKAANRT